MPKRSNVAAQQQLRQRRIAAMRAVENWRKNDLAPVRELRYIPGTADHFRDSHNNRKER